MKKIIYILLLLICHKVNAQIPQVNLNGDFCNEYTDGTMVVQDENGRTAEYKVRAKWRGSYAKLFDKKSFAIKLIDDDGESRDASLLGMREDNNWILDAMAVDKARMRNRVSFDLWNDFSTETYIKKDYDEEKSFNGTHGVFVELTLNGNYNGLYCLTEKIDRKQLKLKKMKKDIVHGVLYKAEGWTGTMFFDYEEFDNSSPTWMDWESKYPEIEDEGTAYYNPLADAIKFVLNSSKQEFASQVEEYFDLPVWLDYFLFIKVINAIDNDGKNTFTYIYDIDKDKRLGIAPWDLDASWGRSYDGSEWLSQEVTFPHNLAVRLINEYPEFLNIMAARYKDLRSTFFEANSLKKRFADYYDYLKGYGVLDRETQRWSGVNDISLNFEVEQDFIKEWIDSRLVVLDKYFAEIESGIYTIKLDEMSSSPVYFDVLGRRLNGKPTQSGIYIHDGKKIVIK